MMWTAVAADGRPVHAGYAAGFEGPVRTLVHALKYGGRTSVALDLAVLAAPLARVLADVRAAVPAGEAADEFAGELDGEPACAPRPAGIDAIAAVPLHGVRRRERGYDQAVLIARRLADLLEVPADPGCLTRVRATRSQTALARGERIENVRAAFAAGRELCHGRRLLLVDDVVTTGATFAAAADALFRAGASSVACLAVAGRRLADPDRSTGKRPPAGPKAVDTGRRRL